MTYLKLPQQRWWKNATVEDAEWLLKKMPLTYRQSALSLSKKAPLLVDSGMIDRVELDFLAEEVAQNQLRDIPLAAVVEGGQQQAGHINPAAVSSAAESNAKSHTE
jgi:hypothetical protein